MMAQSRAESTRDTYNYGQYLNQFPPNTIKVIREFDRIQKRICRHNMSIIFNEICINEEMLPKYTHIYIYIYIYIYMLRCQCCNGYRLKKSTRCYEFKSWSRQIAFHIPLISFGKVWIQLSTIQLWVNSWGRLGSLPLVRQSVYVKENWIQIC